MLEGPTERQRTREGGAAACQCAAGHDALRHDGGRTSKDPAALGVRRTNHLTGRVGICIRNTFGFGLREDASEEEVVVVVVVYELRRISGNGADLALTEEHEAIARPRKGEIHWDAFDRSLYDVDTLDGAARLWKTRAGQEMHSLALFTEIAGQLHLLGAPLDWSGAFARMIADEVRHTDLCLRMCESLGRPAAVEIDPAGLHLLDAASPRRRRVRDTIVAAFCIGETISGRMFKRALKAANVPLAREVVSAIVIDETFHGELGWELGALLMRREGEGEAASSFEQERAMLADDLPRLFRHYARVCCASKGPTWARREPEVVAGPNFGTMTEAGYARAFFDGMEEDVVPGLVAIGFPEAAPAYAALVAELE